MTENEEASIVEPKKPRTVQLRPTDLDVIEEVRRKFAEGVIQQSGLQSTNAEDLDVLRLSLRAAMLPEIPATKLATEMALLRADLRSRRKTGTSVKET